jgi:hypothetical protein
MTSTSNENSSRSYSSPTLWFLAACVGLVGVVAYGICLSNGLFALFAVEDVDPSVPVLLFFVGFQLICWTGFGITSRSKRLTYRMIVPIVMSIIFVALGAILFILSLLQPLMSHRGHMTIG